MNAEVFKQRTKSLALRIIRLVESLPNTKTTHIIGKQIIRSSTSVGANYRASCRAKSTADMINKLKIVEEEADETMYWMELLVESRIVSGDKMKELIKETDEIISMTVSSIKTLRNKH
ncbi:four helix bundle protein [bacterium]|nr:four helix bundle protein [bacterium]